MTPSALDVAVDVAAVSRIVRLIQIDEVPFGVPREKFLQRWENTKLGDLATCPWCCSVHVAAAVALLRWRFPRFWNIAARVLAGSEVTGHLAHLAER